MDNVTIGLAVATLAAAVIGGATAFWGGRNDRKRAEFLLEKARTKTLRALEHGEQARVRGIALRAGSEITAPFSRRPCLGYRATVERDTDRGWTLVLFRQQIVPFDIAADGLQARVEGPPLFALGVDTAITEKGVVPSSALADFEMTSAGDLAVGNGPLRYHEAVIEHGDAVWVLGRAEIVIDPTGRRESDRGQPVKRVIRGTERDPIVVADQDIPGVLNRFE